MGESSADAQQASGAKSPSANEDQEFWEFADLGFDTKKKLWFIQFYNATNENVGTYFARIIDITGGRATQYQWKDAEGRTFWHARERFYATEMESFSIDQTRGKITLVFKNEEEKKEGDVPSEFAYLLYAYHLSSKNGGRAPMGFVEFYDAAGRSVGRLDNRWIIIEGVNRRTFGEPPRIRIRVERKEIGRIIASNTALIIQKADS